MSNNAFASSSAPSSQAPQLQQNEVPENSQNSYFLEKFSFIKSSSEQKMMMIGGGVLFIGLLFVIISNFGGTDLKASLANQAPAPAQSTSSLDNQDTTAMQETEIVYKDQYGNILTPEQVENILHPKKTETVVVNTENTTRTEGSSQQAAQTNTNDISSENSGNEVVYPAISPESVEVDSTKDTLYVKKDDAQKLLAENRLVKKIVDNRPIYVEPITGAVVELIQPIERPLVGRTSFVPAPPSVVPVPNYLKGNSSAEVSRGGISSGEITRIASPSSAEIGR